jgi:hypothetical protein
MGVQRHTGMHASRARHASLSYRRDLPMQTLVCTGKFEFLESLEARALGRVVTRKPVLASEGEVQANPRSRSAKLRVLERLLK